MITLYQPPGDWGVPSLSPFCVKLELWLRLMGIPFETRPGNPQESPTGKVPYIRTESGELLADSQLIIERLTQQYGNKLDAHLSPADLAQSHLIRRTLEDGFYWVLVYARWVDDQGFEAYKPSFLKILPPIIGGPILSFLRSTVRKNLHAQGTGRHKPDAIEKQGIADLDALETTLGDKPFLLGELSSIDALAGAFLWSIAGFPADSAVKKRVTQSPRLMAYTERVVQRAGLKWA